jgi:hypothetical protein
MQVNFRVGGKENQKQLPLAILYLYIYHPLFDIPPLASNNRCFLSRYDPYIRFYF